MSLPEGWRVVNLLEVSEYIRGVTYKKTDISYSLENGYIPVLRANNIQSGKLVFQDLVYVNKEKIKSKQLIIEGDVIIAMSSGSRALVGKSAQSINTLNMSFGAFCGLLRPSNIIQKQYFFWFMQSKEYKDKIHTLSAGVNINNLKPSHFEQVNIPLPPLTQQKQIAQKLDQVLARVERIKMALDNTPATIKRFRQSVLALAIRGGLTKDWREKNSHIKEINIKDIEDSWIVKYEKDGKKYRKVKLEPSMIKRDLPKTWKETQLGYIFDIYVGSTPSRKYEAYWNGDIPWVSSGEVAFTQIKDTKEKITEKGLKNTSTNIHPIGTILLAMIGQGKTRGQPAILEIEACHNQNTAGLRVHSKFTESKYLYYYLWERYEKTREIGGGNNQKALNKKTVQNLPFPLPPLEEQKAIVKKVETLFTLADNLEKRVNQAQKQVDRLTQSILAKAFRGEL